MSATKSPAANPGITPDPAHNGSIIRKAFVVEAIANLFVIPLISHTRFTLSFLLKNPSRDINPSSVLFARMFSGLIVGGFTSALLLGATNTRNGIESRRVVYVMLGLGEVMLIPMLALELIHGGADAALSKKVAGISIGFLAPPLLWRLYVLFVRPELLGKYTENGNGGSGATRRDGYGAINTRDD